MQGKVMLFSEPYEKGEKGNTVRTARNGDNNFRTAREQCVLGERILKAAYKNQPSMRCCEAATFRDGIR